jgi:hypothetical protein
MPDRRLYMVQWMDCSTEGFAQMGGGANWIGEAPSRNGHVFRTSATAPTIIPAPRNRFAAPWRQHHLQDLFNDAVATPAAST